MIGGRSVTGKANIGSRFQEIEGMNDHLLEEIRIMKENIEFEYFGVIFILSFYNNDNDFLLI